MPPSPLRRAWAGVPVRSRVTGVDADKFRRWLADLPPPIGYAVSARPLRYRQAPHTAAFCWYDDRLIELQVPEPFRAWNEKVYVRARRKPGRRLAFQWFSETIRFRSRREVLRFLYCHEFYHWYLREVRGKRRQPKPRAIALRWRTFGRATATSTGRACSQGTTRRIAAD